MLRSFDLEELKVQATPCTLYGRQDLPVMGVSMTILLFEFDAEFDCDRLVF